MATTQRKTDLPESGELSAEEVKDDRDTSPRGGQPDKSGTRVRAIPAKGGTEVVVRKSDFKQSLDIDHPEVKWNFRKDDFTVKVGEDGGITKEAADALTKKHPESFEYIQE